MAKAGQTSSTTAEMIPIIDEHKHEEMSREEWFVSIMAEPAEIQSQQQTPCIHRAPAKLRQAKENLKFFEPTVVSLGPYHHGQSHLEEMERQKLVAAKCFVSNSSHQIETFYSKVVEVADEARKWYSNDFMLEDLIMEKFTRMMFLDACFVLEFINSRIRTEESTCLAMRTHLEPFVVRDMFLLENQLPFIVLQELMGLKCMEMEIIDRFILSMIKPPEISRPWCSWMGFFCCERPQQGQTASKLGNEELHLLHRLRCHLLTFSYSEKVPSPAECDEWHSFRSVMELKEAGIQFRRSSTNSWKDVRFKSGIIYGKLLLPPIIIDDSTQHRLLNLMAYEMCPNGPTDYGVTSYVCLLDSFIDHPEDVKELRDNEILLNGLGSDEEVTDLFNVVATDLAPDPYAYAKVMKDIRTHCKNRCKTHCATLFYTHFSSPWTIVSLIAAIFLIILTIAQTYFSIFPQK